MSAQTKEGLDFCLECHWEAFHLNGKNSLGSFNANKGLQQWTRSPDQHYGTSCCDFDDCSFDNCSSVCDGFLDCDDLINCSTQHCQDKECQDIGPVCFDEHCFDGSDATAAVGTSAAGGYGLGSLLRPSFTSGPLSAIRGQELELRKGGGSDGGLNVGQDSAVIAPSDGTGFFDPYMVSSDQCVMCHGLADHNQRKVAADAFWMSLCTDLPTNCQPSSHGHGRPAACTAEHTHGDSPCCLPPSCFQHCSGLHPLLDNGHARKNSIDSAPTKAHTDHYGGPCRVHLHHCLHHAHAHSHPYSPLSRQSRGSVSSHVVSSSPGDTPPPLESGKSSLLTRSPEFSPETQSELSHICKWVVGAGHATCNAAFPDEGALQEHLASTHCRPINGDKGHGYYCRWEGCHRPGEPFSQKSKLQGHFLTHSNREWKSFAYAYLYLKANLDPCLELDKNFKCKVCGKQFARQATLERHARSHRGEKPYRCDVCGKAFTDSSELSTYSIFHIWYRGCC